MTVLPVLYNTIVLMVRFVSELWSLSERRRTSNMLNNFEGKGIRLYGFLLLVQSMRHNSFKNKCICNLQNVTADFILVKPNIEFDLHEIKRQKRTAFFLRKIGKPTVLLLIDSGLNSHFFKNTLPHQIKRDKV